MKPNKFKRGLAVAGRLGSVGIELGASIVVGLVGGNWLDGYFGTEPWLALFGLIVGSIAGFRSLIRALNQHDNQSKRKSGLDYLNKDQQTPKSDADKDIT